MKAFCSEAKFLVILKFSLVIVFISSGSSSVTIAKVGDAIELTCSSRDCCPEWEYRPLGDSARGHRDREICSSDKEAEKYDPRFNCKLLTDNGAAFVLTIQRVISRDAGTYVCKNSDAETLHSTKLIVTDDVPQCLSNVDLSEVIGSNDCRLSQDVVWLSCSAAFHGSDASTWPLLQWRIEGQESPLNSTCVSNSGTVTCTLVLEASAHLVGKSFLCSNFGEKHKCQMGPVRVLYAFNQSDVTIKTAYPGAWTFVVCEANTNSHSCSYKWKEIRTHSDGNDDTVSNHSTMALSTPGRYRCEARCSLRGHTCLIFPITINVQENEQAVPSYSAMVSNLTQITSVSTNAAKSASHLAACWSVILVGLIIAKLL